MNQEKIGLFIAECRKDKKMTQAELAERLGVTNKSISMYARFGFISTIVSSFGYYY